MRANTNPLTGAATTRRRRNGVTRMSGGADDAVIKSKALGANTVCYGIAGAADFRVYVPGMDTRLASTAGSSVVSYYATGVFRPGTSVRWEPTISPTQGGRMFVGFTDNPEVIRDIYSAWSQYVNSGASGDYATYSNLIKGLGNLVSFPAWQEWESQIPSRLRRKRFDTNTTVDLFDVDVVERSAQLAMFACADGFTSITAGSVIGSFWYHDVVDVEGLHSIAT